MSNPGPPHREIRQIPLCVPCIGQAEKDAAIEAIESGCISHGPYNERFESEFASYLGVRHAIAMNSCASALEIALRVNGITGEVVVPSFTFVATANAVVNAGATPVFCDVEPRSRNVSATLIESAISDRTEAVVVVHFGGQPCPMDEIVELCERRNLLLIEDSAETLGATWNGRQAGSFGIGCFSFYATKSITTGEGGMLTCNDDQMAKRARSMIGHGVAGSASAVTERRFPWQRDALVAGCNYRMSNILAAIGYHQLRNVESMNRMRRAIATHYDQQLASLADVVAAPLVMRGATHVYQMYTVVVAAGKRDDLVMKMRRCGIGASVHFDPPVHRQAFYRDSVGSTRVSLSSTEALSSSIVSLPLYPSMTPDDVDYIVAVLKESL